MPASSPVDDQPAATPPNRGVGRMRAAAKLQQLEMDGFLDVLQISQSALRSLHEDLESGALQASEQEVKQRKRDIGEEASRALLALERKGQELREVTGLSQEAAFAAEVEGDEIPLVAPGDPDLELMALEDSLNASLDADEADLNAEGEDAELPSEAPVSPDALEEMWDNWPSESEHNLDALLEAESARSDLQTAATPAAAERRFLHAICSHEVLSREAEAALISRAQGKGPEALRARNLFLRFNMRLVVSIARRFSNSTSMSLGELVAEGSTGLVRAVEKFELERKLKFSTYAYAWVQQAITRAIENQSRLIRIPAHTLRIVNSARRRQMEAASAVCAREAEMLEASDSVTRSAIEADATWKRLNAVLERAEHDYQEVTRGLNGMLYETGVVSLSPADDSEGMNPLESYSELAEECRAHEGIEQQQQVQAIHEALARLPKRHAAILAARSGVGDTPQRSLSVLASEFGVSAERIRQIEAEAREMLAEIIKEKYSAEDLL